MPLALASILTGGFLAAAAGQFNGIVVGLAALTTILLQILSNLANDYGDSQNGADSVHREGPLRAVQAGDITAAHMKQAMGVFGAAAFVSGLALLWVALGAAGMWILLTFLLLGPGRYLGGRQLHRRQQTLWLRRSGRRIGIYLFWLGGRVRHLFSANPDDCHWRYCCPPPA